MRLPVASLAAELSVQAEFLVFLIVQEILDAIRENLDRGRDLAYQALGARVEMDTWKQWKQEHMFASETKPEYLLHSIAKANLETGTQRYLP